MASQAAKATLQHCESDTSLGGWTLDEIGGHAQAQATFSIEQGQIGLRFLTQCAVVTSCVNSAMVCIGFPGSSAGLLRSAAHLTTVLCIVPYIVALCQCFLALTAALFEVEVSFVQKIRILNAYQDLLLDQIPCIAEVLGRGLFYLLQGITWLLFFSIEEPQHLVIGAWLTVVAVFHVCVHLNCLPRRIMAKTRRHPVDSQRDIAIDAEVAEERRALAASNLLVARDQKVSSRPQAVVVSPAPNSTLPSVAAAVAPRAVRSAEIDPPKFPVEQPSKPTMPPKSAPQGTTLPAVVVDRKQASCCVLM